MRTPGRLRIAALCVVLGSLPLTSARAQKPPDVVIGQSIQALSEVTRNPKTGMPRLVMRDAQGIAIVPSMFKAGFVVGARFGRGVLLIRQPDGSWSNPVFIHLVGGSFGFQAGAQKTDLILVFQTQRGLERFIKGRDKLTLGVDVGVAAGPSGKRFEAGTDVALKSEILSYSNSRGVFAGVSAEGGTLQIDWRANMLYYGRPVSVGEIVAINSTLPVPIQAATLQQMLAEKTALPVGVPVEPGVIVERPGRVVEGEPIILEEEAEVVEGAPPRTSSSVRSAPEAKPRPRPRVIRPEYLDEDELDPLPSARPEPLPSAKTNDEDLPAALPDPRPARPDNQPLPKPKAKVESVPKPKPKPEAEPGLDLDSIPPLDPPKS